MNSSLAELLDSKVSASNLSINESEALWILESQLPSFCEDLQKEFQDCLNFILKSSKSSNLGEELQAEVAEDDDVLKLKDSRLTTFEGASGALKGLVVIDGCFITEAEITTRFKTLPRGSVKTQINRNNPWRLIQIQNIINYLKLSLACLEERLFDFEKKALRPELTPTDVYQIVTTLKGYVRTSIDNLISPVDSIEQDIQVFSPKIPDDLTINIVIKDNALLITAEQSTQEGKPGDFLDNVKLGLLQESGKGGGVFHRPHKGSHAFCEVKIQKFETLMTLLLRSWELCSDLGVKLMQVVGH